MFTKLAVSSTKLCAIYPALLKVHLLPFINLSAQSRLLKVGVLFNQLKVDSDAKQWMLDKLNTYRFLPSSRIEITHDISSANFKL